MVTIVVRQDAQILVQALNEAAKTAHRSLIEVYMHVADVKDREIVETRRKSRTPQTILFDDKSLCVPLGALVETR